MIYRAEIDGLRAFAVLPVIFYHAGFALFSGGFVGVDVFFVISGYLITSIILEEKAQGRFTLAGFYERRARRILPALFFVLLTCLPFAWWLLLPHELEDFGASLVAVAAFASNFLFWLQTDYFAATAEQIPLLHTWSLAVEEQYYLVFPLLIMLFWKLGQRWLVVLVSLIALLSLGWSEWMWRQSVEANFFLIPSRAWELMLGSLTAFYLRHNAAAGCWLAQLAAVAGLLMLAYAVFFFDSGMPFPGLYALLPTLGTVLLILFATPVTWVGKLLSLRILVGIGLVSYSAYLWHQPLFVFARMYVPDELGLWVLLGLSLASLAMAYLSWRWVEKPFRDCRHFSHKQIFMMSLLGSLAFMAFGGWLVLEEGVASRFG